jgi:hypothetical protein
MATLILITLLLVSATLIIIGLRNTEGEGDNPRKGKLLIAAGLGVVAITGLIVYSADIQKGLFGIGIIGLLGLIYLVQGLKTAKNKSN